jgi:hypothetical protein
MANQLKVAILFAFVMFVCFLNAGSVLAQITTGNLSGTVTDKEKKESLIGAKVTATHVPTGSKYGSVTDVNGRYQIRNVKAGGPYSISFSYIGYKGEKVDGVFVELGGTVTLNSAMVEASASADEIVVTADRNAVFDKSKTGAANAVTKEQIEKLPTVARSLNDFARLSPQVSSTGIGVSAVGRNPRFNNLQIDGAVNNDVFGLEGNQGLPGGQTGANPVSLDAIQELQIVVAPFDVRNGNFSGAGLNAITRGGTNTWSGTVYGFGRNQGTTGTSPDFLQLPIGTFREAQYGASVGGPLIKDKLFFFTNVDAAYREQVADFALGVGGSRDAGISPDSISAFKSILDTLYRFPGSGSFADDPFGRTSVRFFTRIDWNISEKHKLMIRNNYVNASDDRVRRTSQAFGLSSFNWVFDNVQNQTVLQLQSAFSSKVYNEFTLGYQVVRDKRSPSVRAPYIVVNQPGGRTIEAGGERSTQRNGLDQDNIEISNNLSWVVGGGHTLTGGFRTEFFTVSNLFIQDAWGTFNFNSLASFRQGIVAQYRASYAQPGQPVEPLAEFTAAQASAYLQDEWAIRPNLNVVAGARLDMPIFFQTPSENPLVQQVFGIATNQTPSGTMMWSPRLGFNWDVFNDKTTQIRGGVGIFTGRMPLVWFSNQFSNTGREFIRINQTTGLQPGLFTPFADSLRIAGQFGLAATATTTVNVNTSDFKLPQTVRYNLAVDQKIAGDFYFTGEFVYSNNRNEPFYSDLNLQTEAPAAPIGTATSDIGGRPVYGTFAANTAANPRGTTPFRRDTRFVNAIALSNVSDGYAYLLTAELKKTTGLVTGNFAYTFGESKDRNSLSSSVAVSNWEFNYVPGNPNNAPLATSLWEVRHRLLASLNWNFNVIEGGATTVSLVYVGQTGQPYSFIYDGDVNADGSLGNDLIYVPRSASNVNEIQLGGLVGGNFVANPQMQSDFEKYINNNDALSGARGRIIGRNEAREPWRNRLDLSIGQSISTFGKQSLELRLDVINILNLIDNTAGRVQSVALNRDLTLRTVGIANNGRPVFSFDGTKIDPFQTDQFSSRWQGQFSIRYRF